MCLSNIQLKAMLPRYVLLPMKLGLSTVPLWLLSCIIFLLPNPTDQPNTSDVSPSFPLSTHSSRKQLRKLTKPSPMAHRDFSDSHLKPAPLCLRRKTQSGSGPSKDNVPDGHPLIQEERHKVVRDLSLLVRTTSPRLASLVSKFEMLDAITNLEPVASDGGPSPRQPDQAHISLSDTNRDTAAAAQGESSDIAVD
ncbi:hypothetical protein VTK26DRAFT_2768 [Humicola hyalothermophila]